MHRRASIANRFAYKEFAAGLAWSHRAWALAWALAFTGVNCEIAGSRFGYLCTFQYKFIGSTFSGKYIERNDKNRLSTTS